MTDKSKTTPYVENLIRSLETVAASRPEDFMEDDFLCGTAARLAGEAAATLRHLTEATKDQPE